MVNRVLKVGCPKTENLASLNFVIEIKTSVLIGAKRRQAPAAVNLVSASPQRPSRIQVAASAPTSRRSPINPAKTGNTPMPRTTVASRVRRPNQSSP
jgi:hypothetical protein